MYRRRHTSFRNYHRVNEFESGLRYFDREKYNGSCLIARSVFTQLSPEDQQLAKDIRRRFLEERRAEREEQERKYQEERAERLRREKESRILLNYLNGLVRAAYASVLKNAEAGKTTTSFYAKTAEEFKFVSDALEAWMPDEGLTIQSITHDTNVNNGFVNYTFPSRVGLFKKNKELQEEIDDLKEKHDDLEKRFEAAMDKLGDLLGGFSAKKYRVGYESDNESCTSSYRSY